MTVRELPKNEREPLMAFFAARGEAEPETDAIIVIAEDEGEIVGCLVAQRVMHLEPLWVKESHRGRYVIPPLINKVRERLPELKLAFAHCEDQRVQKLLGYFGMKKLSWQMFRWVKED